MPLHQTARLGSVAHVLRSPSVHLLPDAYPFWFEDPQTLVNVLRAEQRDRRSQKAQDAIPVRVGEAADHDPFVLAWRVGANVGKIQVEREQDAVFSLTGRCDDVVLGADHLLVVNRRDVPPGIREKCDGLNRDVFVEFRTHGIRSGWQTQDMFLSEF